MSLILSERYPDRCIEPSEEYPRGSFKNRSAPNVDDGSFLEKDWKNDERAFQDAILLEAGVEPDGEIDTGLSSQVFDALKQIIDARITTSTSSLYGKATGSSDALTVTLPRTVTLDDGLMIYVRAQYANATTAPTLQVEGTNRKAIVKGNNQPLALGDITGAGFVMHLTYDDAFDRWILLNPSTGVTTPETIPPGMLAYFPRTGDIDGWLYVDSREHNRSDYARLIEAAPDMILPGSTPETFKLKDPRGYFLRVWDNGKGVDPGRALASSQGDAMRNLTGNHAVDANAYTATGVFEMNRGSVGRESASGHGAARSVYFDASRQVPTANEFRPKNFAFALYIKI